MHASPSHSGESLKNFETIEPPTTKEALKKAKVRKKINCHTRPVADERKVSSRALTYVRNIEEEKSKKKSWYWYIFLALAPKSLRLPNIQLHGCTPYLALISSGCLASTPLTCRTTPHCSSRSTSSRTLRWTDCQRLPASAAFSSISVIEINRDTSVTTA